MSLTDLRAADLGVPEPRFDDILLCGACGQPSRVTLTGTALLTEEEFNSLDEDERNDLMFAQRAIKRKLRNN